jgi:hypothetical protein
MGLAKGREEAYIGGMRRLGGMSLLVLAAAVVAAGLSAHATSAAPFSAKSTVDVTYSCPVQKAKVVTIYASTAFKPPGGPPAPGALGFNTGIETKTVNGTTTTKAQASVTPKKNGVTLDKKACTKLKKRISLSAKGLPYPVTVTPKVLGYTNQACDAAKRIVFRLQVHIAGGKPTSAVLAVRNADAKSKPIALVNWSPKKASGHFSSGCNSLG